MHIYSYKDLYNKYVQDKASYAYQSKSISEESYKNICTTYTSRLYTPNYFIRIALGVLTLVATMFSALLIGLLFGRSITGMSIFLTAACYVALEVLVNKKSYYNAGIDNLLIFFSLVFFVSVFVDTNYNGRNIILSGITMTAACYLAIRFTDGFMAVISYLALVTLIFFCYIKLGNIAKATVPFLIMIVAAASYFLVKKQLKNEKLVFYHNAFKDVMLTTLLIFYAAGNFFVVKELGKQMFGHELSIGNAIPFGWLFWIFTFAIPVAYVAYGISTKQLLFTRTGLAFVAASVFTFRYYYQTIPVEMALLVAGAILSVVSYLLINYLKQPKGGFTFDKIRVSAKESIDIKSLILAQVSVDREAPNHKAAEFGGGNFGSGGAGGKY